MIVRYIIEGLKYTTQLFFIKDSPKLGFNLNF